MLNVDMQQTSNNMVLSYTFTEEAKKFEDGLQEAKDFFSIQKKHVSNTFVCYVYVV